MPSSRRALLAALSAALAGCGASPNRSPTGNSKTASPTDTPTDPATTSPTPKHASPERVELDDDRVRWRVDLPADELAGLAAARDRLYVGSGRKPTPTPEPGATGGTGQVTALSLPDGAVLQHRPLNAPIAGELRVHDGDPYLTIGYSSGFDGRSQRLVRLDSELSVRWESPARDAWLSVYDFDGDTAYLGTGDDALSASGETTFAVDLANGSERWSVAGGDAYGGRVSGETLFASYGGMAAVALDTASGSERWRRSVEILHAQDRQFPTAAGHLFAAVERDGSYGIAGINAADGTTSWTYGLDASSPFVVTSATAVGETVVGTEYDGLLFARDAATGTARWERSFDNRLAAPLVADSVLYTSVLDGPVVAVDAADGTVRWQAGGGEGYARILLAGKTLLAVSSGDGKTTIVARRRSDGSRRWRRSFDGRYSSLAVSGGTLLVGSGESVYGVSLD